MTEFCFFGIQIGSTVNVFIDIATGNPVLIIASGSNQVDVRKLENLKGIRLVKADGIFVKQRVRFAIAGVPPVGHNEKMVTFLDPTLMEYEWIWAAAGTPFAVFRLNSQEIQKMTDGEFVDLAAK